MTPSLAAIRIATGHVFVSEPGYIVMSSKSLAAIKAISPITVSAPAI
jgi:hypothetical protein